MVDFAILVFLPAAVCESLKPSGSAALVYGGQIVGYAIGFDVRKDMSLPREVFP